MGIVFKPPGTEFWLMKNIEENSRLSETNVLEGRQYDSNKSILQDLGIELLNAGAGIEVTIENLRMLFQQGQCYKHMDLYPIPGIQKG